MEPETLRSIDLSRMDDGRYQATNRRGGVLPVGSGDGTDFTPVELLLVAIAGCSAIDVDLITGKRATPELFDVRAEGHKVRDEQGNHLVGLKVTFDVRFPEGEGGDRAREDTSARPSADPRPALFGRSHGRPGGAHRVRRFVGMAVDVTVETQIERPVGGRLGVRG